MKVYKSSLDGISFKTSIRSTQPDKNNKFDLSKLPAFRSALGSALISGRPAFRQGAKFEHSHIAVDASMAVTPGIGFREIIYLDLRKFNLAPSETITSMRMRTPRAPKMNAVFSSNFGNSRVNLDITSLHCSVLGDICSIHIDQAGFVVGAMPGMGSDVAVTPDFLQHILLELLLRDILDIPDAIEVYVPHSGNDYSRLGIRGTKKITDNINLSFEASYNIRGKRGFTHTIALGGRF